MVSTLSPAGPTCSHGKALTHPGSPHLCRQGPCGLATARAVIGGRDAGNPEVHPGKCSSILALLGKILGGERRVPGCAGQRRAWTQSVGRFSPMASPALPPRTDKQDASAGDLFHCDLHWPLALFSGTVCPAAPVGSVCCRVRGRRLHWGSRSGGC